MQKEDMPHVTLLNLHGRFVLYNVSLLQIDANYVGEPPPLEVTICNLNDNIDKAFLSDMVRICSVCNRISCDLILELSLAVSNYLFFFEEYFFFPGAKVWSCGGIIYLLSSCF